MEDNIKMTLAFHKWETTSNFSKMEDDLSLKKMEDYLNFSKIEDDFNYIKMKDDLIFPQRPLKSSSSDLGGYVKEGVHQKPKTLTRYSFVYTTSHLIYYIL